MRHRLIQLVAVVLGLACLLGSALLVPTIDRQRHDLKLTYDLKLGHGEPPSYVLLSAALGSFRGLAADILWYRAEHLKRAGKVFEANADAEWITRLQPHFPQVWVFQAWNMAYNISVKCHTPEERWYWVQKGIELLRGSGIPANPKAIPLYRELGWIFQHKVGMTSDDMHWYYKRELALRWQQLLGSPTEGASTQQVLDRFKPIAEAADRYFSFGRLSKASRDRLEALAKANPDRADALNDLAETPLVVAVRKLPELQAKLSGQQQYDLAEQLAPVLAAAQQRAARSTTAPWELFKQDHPEAEAVVEQLKGLGRKADVKTLNDIGAIQMYMHNARPKLLLASNKLLPEAEKPLLRWMIDGKHTAARQMLLAFLRAKTLTEQYHMDPRFMYEMMEKFGPLDWRTPFAQAIYWSALGVQRSGALRDATKFDILNTDRQVIQSLQLLTFNGRISLDPFTGRLDLWPDPRFIPAYETALLAAEKRSDKAGFNTETNFASGYENFLLRAVLYSYLYGDEQQARHYYDKVRKLYGDKPHNLRSGRYLQPLDVLVMSQLRQDFGEKEVSQPLIESLLTQAFSRGLALNHPEIFSRFVNLAQVAYRSYSKSQNYKNPNAGRGRNALVPFKAMLQNAYILYMKGATVPRADLLTRARVYSNTPVALAQETYPRFRETVDAQAKQLGFDGRLMFPPPPGVVRQQETAIENKHDVLTPDNATVERQ